MLAFRLQRLIILYICTCCGFCVHAQDIEDIKNDSRYYCAEGSGTTLEEAESNALAQISRQIAVSISTQSQETDRGERNSDGSVSSSYIQEGSVASYSFASLQNVRMTVLKGEPNAKVFRWVAKAEVDKMFEERKKKILDFVATAKVAEENLQIDDALRNYYWAFMLAKVNRDAVYADFNGKPSNCLTFLPLKIKSVLSRIKVSLVDCTGDGFRYLARMRFTYNDRDVASLQLRYFDGQSFIGPLIVRDGEGELDLVSLPVGNKIGIRYEYSFRKEAENLDAELRAIFDKATVLAIENALVEIPVKVNQKQKSIKPDKKFEEGVTASVSAEYADIQPEKAEMRKRIPVTTVQNNADYLSVLQNVENAIKAGSPQDVYTSFTTEGYKMFETLINKTGKVSLVGKQDYEFIEANGQILGRFCKVKIRFKNGQTFMDNIVFRFNKESGKIQSIAFALTKKAEDDIFNAASSWTEISRYTILQFMEDYQTAYALKRLDYIEKIFSDDALIITGTVLTSVSSPEIEGTQINLKRDNIRYTKQNKQQYLAKLRRHFNEREYIHLIFERNVTQMINAPRLPVGTAFAIQINQIYNSPVYSDKGFLTLVLDASKKLPLIHIRMWQPEKSDMLSLSEFINELEF